MHQMAVSTMSMSEFEDRLLTTDELAEANARDGFRRTPRTYIRYRINGGGPAFVRIGNGVLYPESKRREWLREQIGRAVRSTAEEAA